MTDPVPEPEPEPAAAPPDPPVDDKPEPEVQPEPAVEEVEPEPSGEPEGDPVAHPALLVSRDHLRLLKATLAPDLTDAELELFAQVANRVGLDPFAKQIYAVKRNDSASGAKRMTIQTGIDGLRLIARRTGQMAGRLGPYFCGDDGVWLIGPNDTPLPWIDTSRKPYAAMVGVLRHGDLVPTWGIAHWSEYAVTGNAGKMWEKLPTTMLAKCLPYRAVIETDQGPLPIGRIVKDRLAVRVRSVDLDTGVETWMPVTNWWRNGGTNRWVRLWIPNGTHGNQSIRLTEDHPVWTEHGWVKAGDVEVGTRVAVTSAVLSNDQRQVILGGLLGDGTLGGRRTGANLPHYSESHAVAQADYLGWKATALANLDPTVSLVDRTDGAGGEHPTVCMRTKSSPALAEFRSTTPEERLSELDDLGLAVWFMDDGSIRPTGGLSGSVASALYCCGFGGEFADAAVRWLWDRYRIVASVKRRARNPYLAIGVESTKILRDVLAPYVRFDGSTKRWVAGPVEVGPSKGIVFVPVQRVELRHGGDPEGRYDIEVAGTHTFVYNNVVVSNCAESQAIRATFPAETSGLYTDDEMMQADFKTTAIEANFAEAAARLLSEADPGTFSEIARRAEAIRRTGRDVVNALGLIWQNAGLGKIPELAVGEAKRAQAAILSIEQRIGRNEWGQDVHRLWIDATAAVANGEAPTAAEGAPDDDPPPEPADAPENEPEAPIPADPERVAVARAAVAEMTAEQVADMIRMYETEPADDPAAAAEQLVGLLAADDGQR